jgi:hypothetical protein
MALGQNNPRISQMKEKAPPSDIAPPSSAALRLTTSIQVYLCLTIERGVPMRVPEERAALKPELPDPDHAGGGTYIGASSSAWMIFLQHHLRQRVPDLVKPPAHRRCHLCRRCMSRALSVKPGLTIGDMDSVDNRHLLNAKRIGCRVHPTTKRPI